MPIFKKPFSEQSCLERNVSKLEEARLSLDKARINLEDYLFHVQETKTRVRMLELRIARLMKERELLPAPTEQGSWLRRAVLYVRDAFAAQRNRSAESEFHLVGAAGVQCFFCKHIQSSRWVSCTEQEYIELQSDPLYDLFKGPLGLQPPPAGQPMLYKPKGNSSNGGSWALCSQTFYRANQKNSEIDFVDVSE